MKISHLFLMPALAIAMAPSSLTQQQSPDDPPARVVRMSFIGGAVSFRPADADDWSDATLNYPLTTGDELWTDTDSRAEVSLGSAVMRLAPYTAFTFLALDDDITQIRLTQGTVYVRLRRLDPDEDFEIDTPSGAVMLVQAGTYRVDVDQNGETTTATVRDGQADILSAGSTFSIRPGQAATVVGTDRPTYDVRDAAYPDSWESWASGRDRRWENTRSARYVSEYMPGYEDLDDNGVWYDNPEYGRVWTPRVAAGWAPYRDGHWAWVDPWGWTWIDDAPWGFAPFHYGRWVYVGGGWAWVPGRLIARPVYAPALVVFVGGSNWSVAIGGGYGWFPLAPNEVYVPTYRVSERYARRVNETSVNITIVNVTTIDVTRVQYRNRDVQGGVTVVSRETFVGARPVSGGRIAVPRERMGGAEVLGSGVPLAPTRQSMLARPGVGTSRRPPVAATERVVVSRRTPPPPPVRFSEKEQALNEHPGKPLDRATLNTLRERTPGREKNHLVRDAAPQGEQPTLKPARPGVPESRPATPAPERRQPPAREVRQEPQPTPDRQPVRQPDRQPDPQPARPPAKARVDSAAREQPARPARPGREVNQEPTPPPERRQPTGPPARARADSAVREQPARPARPGRDVNQEPTPPPEQRQPSGPPARARSDSARQQPPAQPDQPVVPNAGAKGRDNSAKAPPARRPVNGRAPKDTSATKDSVKSRRPS